jgi:hypothetical protein
MDAEIVQGRLLFGMGTAEIAQRFDHFTGAQARDAPGFAACAIYLAGYSLSEIKISRICVSDDVNSGLEFHQSGCLPVNDQVGVFTIGDKSIEWVVDSGLDFHQVAHGFRRTCTPQTIGHHAASRLSQRIRVRITQIRQCREHPFLVQPEPGSAGPYVPRSKQRNFLAAAHGRALGRPVEELVAIRRNDKPATGHRSMDRDQSAHEPA